MIRGFKVFKPDCNSSDYNSGDYNSGNWNSGHSNSGHRNSGDYNIGNCNSGNCNSGKRNSGDWNSGHYNSGDNNSGNRNSGNCNSGNWNSGNRNSGNCNSGDWNKSSNVAGCFNTQSCKLRFFDKETDMTFEKWRNSEAYQLMNRIYFRPANWIWADNMTDEEKVAHPEYETTGGYLKSTDLDNWCQKWWDSLTYEEKTIIKNIPNFDANIFFEITGINVNS